MAIVNNLAKIKRIIKEQQKKIGKGSSTVVAVGYTANYALHVHEDLEANHPQTKSNNPGALPRNKEAQAKFLEQAVKDFEPEVTSHIRKALAGGMTLRQALVVVGLRIQRDSQELVPIDTGNLKGSAFTRVIRG